MSNKEDIMRHFSIGITLSPFNWETKYTRVIGETFSNRCLRLGPISIGIATWVYQPPFDQSEVDNLGPKFKVGPVEKVNITA
jgi:hypothetical protein